MTEKTAEQDVSQRSDSRGLTQTTISGVFWSGIQNWGSQSGSLIIFLVLARLLVPADFGLVALANTFVVFFNLVIDQGLSTALVQRDRLEAIHWSTVFWVQLGLGIGLTLLGWLSAGWVAGFFEQPMLVPVLRSLSFIFILRSLILVQRAALRRKFAFKQIAMRSLLSIFLSGLVGIGLALTGYGVWSLVGQQLTFEVVGVVVFWHVSDWRPGFQFSLVRIQELSGFGLSIFCSNVLAFFNNHFDTLLIGYFLGEVALGYYAIAYRVLQVLAQLLIGTGNQVALPVLSRLQTEPLRLLRAFYKIVRYASLIALPIFVGVATLAPEIVSIVFGLQWMPAVPTMQVLAFSGVFYIVLFFNTSVFVAIGRPDLRLWLEAINVVFNTAGCLIAVRWGVLAVAYAYAISDFLMLPMSFWALSKVFKISFRDYVSLFCLPISLTLATTLVVKGFHYWLSPILIPSVVLLACGMMGGATYAVGLWQCSPDICLEIVDLAKIKVGSKK